MSAEDESQKMCDFKGKSVLSLNVTSQDKIEELQMYAIKKVKLSL
jgi:hypothetical protein